MLIMAGILAMAAPSLRGFAASRQVRNAAAGIVTLTKWARLKAISEGRPYRLTIDLDYGEYWLTAQEGANFEELQVAWGQRYTIPEGVVVEWEESTEAERNGYIRFDPSGRTEPATLRLTGRLGTVLDVTCPGPSASYRVEHRPEEEFTYGVR
jgi:Tfp pilus assembly protein FimT